jgi:hypothetical protein
VEDYLGIVLVLACFSRASIADSEVTSSIGNSSASATITIRMYAVADE